MAMLDGAVSSGSWLTSISTRWPVMKQGKGRLNFGMNIQLDHQEAVTLISKSNKIQISPVKLQSVTNFSQKFKKQYDFSDNINMISKD